MATRKPKNGNGNGNGNYNGNEKEVSIEKKQMTITENGITKKIPLNNKQIAEILYGRKINLKCKNKKQKEFVKEIASKEIVLATGPAGVGKSYISVAMALDLLADPNNNFQKIFVVTPNVDVDDLGIGTLPGFLEDKIGPYLFSTYYLMDKIIGKENRKKLQELNIVEPLALSFIRGMSVDSSILIAEESQNTTLLQMKTLLTRIGYNSKFLINGDLEQVDTRNKVNGLQHAMDKLGDMSEIGIIKFDKDDIVRNPLIGKILDRY